MAEFLWGFKTLAEQLGAEVVGEPVEDEHYIDDIFGIRTAHVQTTSKGLMWYAPQANVTGFLPFGPGPEK